MSAARGARAAPRSGGPRRLLFGTVLAVVPALAVVAALPAVSTPAAAQEYAVLGRAACVDCHEPDGRHQLEYEWLREHDGSSPGTQHINAFNQLYDNEAESRRFVQALLPDVNDGWEEAMLYDASIGCMRCHATVVGGEPIDGVTCEGCHGPGSGYNEIHKERGSYRRAVEEGGLRDLIGKPESWSRVCMDCHAMDNAVLIAAGHPSGDEFDLGEKYQPVSLHFIQSRGTYSAAQISGLGSQWLAAARARRDPAVTTPAPGAAAQPEPAEPEPAAQPATEPTPTPADPVTPPATEPAQPATSDPPLTTTDRTPATTQPETPAQAVETAPAVTPARLPPSTAPAPRAPVVDPLLGRALGAVNAGAPDALPRSPAGVVAAIQGRVVTLLTELLTRGASSPVRVTPPPQLPAYDGADAELLRLQHEAIALALEALRIAPPQQR